MFTKSVIAAVAGLAALAGAGQAVAQDWSPDNSGYDRPYRPRDIDPGAGLADRSALGERNDQGSNRGQAPGFLPPRAIMGSLFRRGYRDVAIKRMRGANYVATALSPRGYRVLVVVDGQTAEITGLRPVGFDRPQPFYDGGGWTPRPFGGPRW
jgi:hypothetical protein